MAPMIEVRIWTWGQFHKTHRNLRLIVVLTMYHGSCDGFRKLRWVNHRKSRYD
jgi:chloramphenicol O-acetyltransferase